MTTVRPAAVAGMFYPAEATALSRMLRQLLADVPASAETGAPARPPKVLVVPHAGYVYSGATAARAYALLQPWRTAINRVVLLGPTHRVAVRGLALPAADAFATPLGQVPIDPQARTRLADLPQVGVSAAAHAQEHSLEVQLPFLQTVLERFTLVPLAVGDVSADKVAQVLERLWGDDHTLIVISTDLSHFMDYDAARQTDRHSLESLLALHGPLTHTQACGATPLNGLMQVLAARGLKLELLGWCNSGDTAGDRNRVVGYAALRVQAPPVAAEAPQPAASDPATLPPDAGRVLLPLARSAIAHALGQKSTAVVQAGSPWLHAAGASFVTLTQNGQLRGCIGSLQAHRALADDVRANAVAAALRDPRFQPLSAAELGRTRVEVSVLTTAQPLTFRSEAEALAQLRPGVDGVIFTCGRYRSTFLPQVWEQLPDAAQFMAQLKRKAGLAGDFWSDDVQLSRYKVRKWKEAEVQPQPVASTGGHP
ncbi:MAG: AmmeMemoRadiSam system protein B [Burkholderiaceae bacterium]|nr:AmmeMemoRadiSam system protein B [Burkholderiaceae bacterium]